MASKRTQEASPSSSVSPRCNHDVFLSFRGEEGTIKNFTDQLYTALFHKGIHTFKDNKLNRGEEIASELLKEIEQSRIAIIVFSKNYASSRWCLDEVVKIWECKKTMGQMVLPIFYDVDPSDVRKQSGSFAQAFARHKEAFKVEMEKVQMWRVALTQVANLSGWDLRNAANGHDSKFIQKIVEEVSTKLNQMPLNVAIYLVGMDSRVSDVNMLLDTGSDDVHILGIYGMGGIGKTTIVKVIYNQILYRFEGSSFLENVREVSKQPNGLVHLQEQLLCDILMEKKLTIRNIDGGINLINERLCCKRVLVVLDDVDQLNQLNALARKRDWFGRGSIIIITTRDEHLLNNFQVERRYEVEVLNHDESLQLFSWHAFRKNHPIEDYVEFSKNVVNYAGGLPLALEVLGSFLSDKSTAEWKSALEKLKVIPHYQIQKILRISFEALNDKEEKDIFLDIACFFNGMDKDHVIRILKGCGFFPEFGISVLAHRSLVKVDTNRKLRMHDLLQEMGRDIVREENFKEPGKRSRLWSHEDVFNILTEYTGTEAVEGLILNFIRLKDIQLSTETFAKMHKLRLLQINYVHLVGDYDYLSKELRWLNWVGFPLRSIPTSFHLENLVVLEMQNSNIRKVWKGFKVLKKLKVLNLSHSYYLTKTPDFFGLPCLERLMLEGCTSLAEVHQSIGHLDKLVFLNLKDCKNLWNLPSSISKLKSLENLILSGCLKLDKLPEELGNMDFLKELHVDGTAIKKLPSSIRLLKNLICLSIRGCKGSPSKSWYSFFWPLGSPRKCPNSITLLPASISGLCSLKVLNLSNCNLVEGSIPSDLGSLSSLELLELSQNNFCSLPNSISYLSQLRSLHLNHCKKLHSLPELPSSLNEMNAVKCTSIKRLNLSKCIMLRKLVIGNCSNLVEIHGVESLESIRSIHMERCNKLPNTFGESFQQGLFQRCMAFDFYLPGREVPEWFTHQSMGSSISFEVQDHKFKWLIGCAVYVADDVSIGIPDAPHCVNIKSDRFDLIYEPLSWSGHSVCQDHIWMFYMPQYLFENDLESGDQLEVTITVALGLEVTKCGVHLVYNAYEKSSQSYNQVMIQYTNLPNKADIVDGYGISDKRVCLNKRGRIDNKVGHSSSFLNEEQDPKRLRTEPGSALNPSPFTRRPLKEKHPWLHNVGCRFP